jgi:hypothetical protein
MWSRFNWPTVYGVDGWLGEGIGFSRVSLPVEKCRIGYYIWHGPDLALIGPTWQKQNKFWHLIGQFFPFSSFVRWLCIGYTNTIPADLRPYVLKQFVFSPLFFFWRGGGGQALTTIEGLPMLLCRAYSA